MTITAKPGEDGEKIAEGRTLSPEAMLWQKKNYSAIEAWNNYVMKHGLPLDQFREGLKGKTDVVPDAGTSDF
jgi:hypothetical protein